MKIMRWYCVCLKTIIRVPTQTIEQWIWLAPEQNLPHLPLPQEENNFWNSFEPKERNFLLLMMKCSLLKYPKCQTTWHNFRTTFYLLLNRKFRHFIHTVLRRKKCYRIGRGLLRWLNKDDRIWPCKMTKNVRGLWTLLYEFDQNSGL